MAAVSSFRCALVRFVIVLHILYLPRFKRTELFFFPAMSAQQFDCLPIFKGTHVN
jgi:hypothetical protein